MGPEMGWMQWLIWGTGTLVFGAIIVGVFVAAWRAARGQARLRDGHGALRRYRSCITRGKRVCAA